MFPPSTTSWLRIIAVLWLLWGAVHLLAGVLTVTLDTSSAVQGIADGVDPALLDVTYPAAAGAVIKQHGWNLGWIGLTTMICAVFIWRSRSVTAAWLATLVGGLADVGYFLFLDLGGFVKFVPGTVMTIISGTAIMLTAFVHSKRAKASPANAST